MNRLSIVVGSVVACSLMLVASVALAQTVTLKATSAFPTQVKQTQQFLEFVKKVNANQKNGVKIDYLGGPEVIPAQQQGEAVQRGVIAVAFGPTNYYRSQVPEGQAIVGSTITAPKARANGGMKLLNSIYEKKMNVHLLGWFGSQPFSFHIYTTTKPKFDDAGHSVNGMRIRSVDLYRDILQGLGFVPVTVQAANIYTSLQRGVVGGIAWPLVGVTDLNWQKFFAYRIDPGFFNNTTVVLVNLDDWNDLSAGQRKALQKAAIQFEKKSAKQFAAWSARAARRLKKAGVKTIRLHGPALQNLKRISEASPWKGIKKYGGSHVAELRAHFAPTH